MRRCRGGADTWEARVEREAVDALDLDGDEEVAGECSRHRNGRGGRRA